MNIFVRNLRMQILLVAATEMEIAPFIKDNPSADILITGVGIHATTYQLTKRIHQFDHDMIIQAGIAGAIDPACQLAKVFAVQTDRFADMGVMENHQFKSLFDTNLAGENTVPFKKGGLINEGEILHRCGLDICDALTVNLISDDPKQARLQGAKFRASLETMEGAAFHYVCLEEEVPFLQIRGVSNMLGERDKSKWFLQKSIENLSTELQRIFNELHAADPA